MDIIRDIPPSFAHQFQRERAAGWQQLQQQRNMAGLIDPFALPGMGAPILSTENTFLAGVIGSWQTIGCVIVSTAVDSGNTPTTTLRKGLMMGAVGQFQLAPGVKVKQYDPTATDGSNIAVGILLEDVNMYDDQAGAVADKYGRILWLGYVKAGQLINLDLAARRQLANRVWFDDGFVDASQQILVVQAKNGSVTVAAADNNKMFSTRAAGSTSTFTLPALASVGPSWRCTFYNEVDQTMTVTAPSGTLVAYNSLTSTSVAFSTSSQKIGACVEVIVNDAGTKYLTKFHGANTATLS